MKIKYTINIDDAAELAKHSYKSGKRRLLKFILSFIGIFLISIGTYFIFNYQMKYISIMYILLGIISVIYEPLILEKILIQNIKKAYKKGRNSEIFCETVMTVNKDKTTIKSPNSTLEFKNNSLEKLEENEEYFFLFNTSKTAFIIPKKYFKNKKEELEFKNHYT